MDWADDTAYSLHDIDGIHARYISVGSVTEWASGQSLSSQETILIDNLCENIKQGSYEPYFGSRIGGLCGCTLTKREGFLSDCTNRHAFTLNIESSVLAESQLYKRIALDLIFALRNYNK